MKKKKQKIIGIIPARYASTRFPGKLLFKILGKTLLQRTFENAHSCPIFDELYIATDDERISSHAKDFHAKVLMTSPLCASGTERILDAIQKHKHLEQADIIVNIQGDHPCILPQTIKKMVSLLKEDNSALISTAATLIKDPQDILSPNTVKVTMDKFDYALYFSRHPIPFSKEIEKTTYYHHIGIYAYKIKFLKILSTLKSSYLQQQEDLEQLKFLEHGYKIKVALVQDNPIGIDVPEDIEKIKKHFCK